MIRRIAVAAAGARVAALATHRQPARSTRSSRAGSGNRPAIRLETDFYAYGPGTGSPTRAHGRHRPQRLLSQPVTLFLYWQDREGGNGTRRYFNAHAGFGAQSRDLLSATTTPAKVFVPALTGFKFFGDDGAFGPVPADIPSATGRYMFVFEIRDGAATSVLSRSVAMYNQVDGVVRATATSPPRPGPTTTCTGWRRRSTCRAGPRSPSSPARW